MILTPRQFITATTYRFIGRRKNPILLNIDQILQVYHTRYRNPSGVLSHQPSRSESYARWRNNTLASLGVNCCLYLDSKSQRDTTKRKTAVAGLLVSVWHELNLPPRDFRASWNPRQLCQELMAAWQSDKRVTAAWQQAGTRVKRLNRGGTGTGLRSLDLNDLAVASEVRGNAAGEHRYQPSPMQPEKVVQYFDDVERLRHLLVFDAQRRLWCKKQQHRDGSQREVPYSTSHLSGDSYAVDVDLNIYSRPYQNEGDDLAIHHSSYLAGKAVLCAGMIIIDDGKLLHIDNESGHYKPSTSNLLNLLAALRLEHQIPLANVTTKDVALPNLDGMSVLPLMYFPAARYLAQRGQMSEEDGGGKDSTPWWEDRAARCVAGNLRADS